MDTAHMQTKWTILDSSNNMLLATQWNILIRITAYTSRYTLTHWGRVTHICVSTLAIIGSDNGLLPGRRQTIISTNAGILLIWPLGTHFSGISIDIQTFSFKKVQLKMSSGNWRPFCFGLNVLIFIWWPNSPYMFSFCYMHIFNPDALNPQVIP